MADIYGIPYYILIPLGLLIAFYQYMTRNFGYWKRLGIPEVPPLPITGSFRFDLNSDQGKAEQKWYQKYGKIFGIYESSNPVLMIADPELLKDILIKDFHIFSNTRNIRFGDPIVDRMLFMLEGEKWKDVRNIMTPTFTSGKMRLMSKVINECAETLVDNFLEAADDKKEIDLAKYLGAYTMDVIARSSFGIKLNSRKDPNNPFVKEVRNAVSVIPWRFLLAVMFPGVAKLIRLRLFNPKTSLFFKNVTMKIINERKNMKEGQKPKDFLQILMDSENEDPDSKDGKKKLDLDDIVAQCVLFFIAGYFTTAATLSFTAHQLAVRPEIQEKLINEIDENVKDKEEEIDFDTVAGMKYLDAIIQETVRYYTPAPRIERRCREDYKLGDTGIVIPKSMLIAVPIYALNHDPQYFPEPNKFNPDRFMPENKDRISPLTNIPFGAGPRMCLGMRFAMMEIKIGLVKALKYIRIKPGVNTKEEPEFVPTRGLNRPQNVFLKLVRRD